MTASIRKILVALAALSALTLIWSCNEGEEDGDQYISWTLNAAYADYDTVDIKLMNTLDTGKVLEEVWHDAIPDPVNFPKYKLTAAKGKAFTIRIRCYNKNGDLLLAKDVPVEGKEAKPAVVLVPDVRLLSLKLSVGDLYPAFRPGIFTYTAQVGADVPTVTLTATPLDAGNTLAIGTAPATWGAGTAKELTEGANTVVLTVTSKDGKLTRSYEVAITRGRIVPPEEVTSVTLSDRALTLYTGDDPTALKATVNPPGALIEWTSQDGNVVRVDGNGRLSPQGPGDTKVIAKAGNFSDECAIKVKKDVPIIDAGQNLPVKVGTEVTFNVTITQEHGTLVLFKYDLDGDGKTDNTDTTNAPASVTLKHTYAAKGEYIARFDAKDSEGNAAFATRTITVDDGAFQIAITSPSRDTTINSKSILIKYTVNGAKLERQFIGLSEGPNPLAIDTGEGADKRTAKINVTVDTQGPGVPVFTGTTPVTTLKPTWTWKSGGGGGNGIFRSAMDSAGLAIATTGSATAYTPAANLIPGDHFLWVQEKDSAENWSIAGKFKITIKTVDLTPPNAPKVMGNASTPTVPKWTWTSDGGGGNGLFKSKVDDSTLAGAIASTDTAFTLPGTPVSGKTYILYVAERDSADNWSKLGRFATTFEPTKPGVIIIGPKPSGTLYTDKSELPFSGTAGGVNTITKVSYKINGVDAANAQFSKPNWSIPSVPFSEGSATLITIIATDSVGQTGEATLTVFRDNTNPGPPNITTTPTTPTKSPMGSWAWTAGTDGSGSGLNDNYRYSLDSLTWTETTALLVNAVALKEGANTFHLQEQDKAGNWSASAKRIVVSDVSGPGLTVTNPIANSTVTGIHVIATATATDAFSSVASVTVSGQESGNGTATLAAGTWSTGDLVLRGSGLDTLTFTATDAVGNTTVKPVVITINVALPSIDIVYPAEGMPYNKDTITVQYKVNSGALQTKLFTKPPGDPDGNWAMEIVSAANEAGQTNKKTVTILRDKTGPGAPTVTPAGVTWTKVLPSWSFVTGGDAGSGPAPAAWECSYAFNGGTATTTASATTTCSVPSGLEGNYTFNVRQQDKAGNWSPFSATSTLKYDKTPPVATVSSPKDGFVTGKASMTLTCSAGALGGGIKTLTPGPNTYTCTSTDSAGNEGSSNMTAYYLPNTLFVKQGGGGLGTGWVDASGNLETVLKAAKSGWSVWIAGGVYASGNKDSGYVVGPGVEVYGGFPATTITAKSVSERVYAKADTTYLHNPSNQGNVVTLAPKGAAMKDVTLNGLQVVLNNDQYGVYVTDGFNITMRKLKFLGDSDPTKAGIYAENTLFAVDSCTFTSFSMENYWINASATAASQTMTISNSIFTGNVWFGGGGMSIYGYAKAVLTNVWFMDSYKAFSGLYHLEFNNTNGEIDMKDCVFKASSQGDAISIGSATRVITTTTFSPTPPAPPVF